jgi:hypothetical protein
MDGDHRLLRFGRAAKERTMPIWKSAVLHRSEPVLQWLKLQFGHGRQWLKARPRGVFWAVGIGIALAFLVFSGATAAGAALVGLGSSETSGDSERATPRADER